MKFLLSSSLFIFLITTSDAAIKSTTGTLNFDVDADSTSEMEITSTGIGIGMSPSSNLSVAGNARATQSLTIGQGSLSANLGIQGSIGFNYQNLNTSGNLTAYSYYFVDSTSDNIFLQLPEANSHDGTQITVKKTTPSNQVTLYSESDDIDDKFTVTLEESNANTHPAIKLMSADNTWHVLSIQGNAQESGLSQDNLIA